jgi:hypothetical protein
MSLYRASRGLDMEERQVLAREQALKASAPGGSSRTTYQYAVGPDGKRYIVGADVSIIASEDALDSVPGVRTSRSVSSLRASPAQGREQGGRNAAGEEDIAKLERTEREVIAHENAHKSAAGRFGGPVHYTYTTGPDGKRYITGGDVSVHTPATNDPEEALRNASQVMRAALAPGDPSGQDIAVASSAAAMAASARAMMMTGENDDDRGESSSVPASGKKSAQSYEQNLSPCGLWSSVEGHKRPDDAKDIRNPLKFDAAA